MLTSDSAPATEIDAAISTWRQGDLALDERWFIHVGDPSSPLTEASSEAEEAGPQALQTDVEGLVVVTQTCDIVRSCVARPYIEVSPLVQVSERHYQDVKKGRRPAMAAIPAIEARRLVADLDRVMTVEKSILATWTRTPGHSCDAEIRNFAQTLARKRQRFAFPDDFNTFVSKLRSRLTEKHDKASDEGRALRALQEIRVQAAPSWGADSVELLFFFIRQDDETSFEGTGWDSFLDAWLKRVEAKGRFTPVNGQVTTLNDMSAQDYRDSDRLDLDHLSTPAD